MSLYERIVEAKAIGCHDRMRDRFRPYAPKMKTARRTAERMSDLARGLKGALACRDKEQIDYYMTLMGKNLVDVKGAINDKASKRALDYERKLMFPSKTQKVTKREPVRSSR